jgi:hypothetical protein
MALSRKRHYLYALHPDIAVIPECSQKCLELCLQSIGEDLSASLPFDSRAKLEKLLALVLPLDDSAFQFSPVGAGISPDLDATLKEIFTRFVEMYSSPSESPHRDDDEVWKVYRGPLERREIIPYLNPKKIISPNYDYEFKHSWKNATWHVCEPVSFDLLEPTSILDKANRWLGRATSLADSSEKFKMYILLGEPQSSGLKNAFVKAQNILHKMPGEKELIRESEAEGFAEEIADQIKAHGTEGVDPR